MVAEVALKLTGPMDHLRLVWQTGETLLEGMPFVEDPEGTRYNILLALQEMVTNVLRHAYELDESRAIEVVFHQSLDSFAVTLRDQGPPFDPLSHDTTTLDDCEAMPTAAGGYGIYIARMVMDQLDYRRDGDWNCLSMRKSLRAPTSV